MRNWIALKRLRRLLRLKERLEDRIDRMDVKIKLLRRILGIAAPAAENTRALEALTDFRREESQ